MDECRFIRLLVIFRYEGERGTKHVVVRILSVKLRETPGNVGNFMLYCYCNDKESQAHDAMLSLLFG